MKACLFSAALKVPTRNVNARAHMYTLLDRMIETRTENEENSWSKGNNRCRHCADPYSDEEKRLIATAGFMSALPMDICAVIALRTTDRPSEESPTTVSPCEQM